MVELSETECLGLLAACDLGRIAVIHQGAPAIFPVNYAIATIGARPVIALRTRPGNVIDHVGEHVGFEIDGVDPGRDGGWSVLVRGRLRAVDADEALDSYPILDHERDAWRVIVPHAITGRRITADPMRWAFHPAAYL